MRDHLVATPLDTERLSSVIRESQTAEDALTRLVEALGGAFPIYRASLRRVDLYRNTAVLVAVWSRLPTRLTKGLEVSLRATSYPEVLRSGRSVLPAQYDEPLLDHVLRAEGIRSWVTTPMYRGAEIRGLLTFSSWRAGAFVEEDLAFFDALGLAVQDHLAPLLGP